MLQANERTDGAYTVQVFCDIFSISISHFYELRRNGLAPRTFKAGRRTLVSRSAVQDWVAEREQAGDRGPRKRLVRNALSQ